MILKYEKLIYLRFNYACFVSACVCAREPLIVWRPNKSLLVMLRLNWSWLWLHTGWWSIRCSTCALNCKLPSHHCNNWLTPFKNIIIVITQALSQLAVYYIYSAIYSKVTQFFLKYSNGKLVMDEFRFEINFACSG